MSAEIHCEKIPKRSDKPIPTEVIYEFLKEHHVQFGIDDQVVEKLSQHQFTLADFPLTIAQGRPPEQGKDGTITYAFNTSLEVDRDLTWNFRDVMRIPSVENGQKLATITLPTQGQDGMNVLGVPIKAKPGRPVPTKAGKNVRFDEQDLTFYAMIEGQVSATEQRISVYPLYEVNETLSMKTGNLDFVGSIVIRGDVPTGYTVKAKGDIKIFGIVEAAHVIAGGSVYVSEGLAGLQKGMIQAGEDVHIGYINQGTVEVGNSLFVENSIIHSHITANNDIFCQRGNIIGGSLSAGKVIEAKDIGNRMSTETNISLGISQSIHEEMTNLQEQKKQLLHTLEKLNLLGKRLEQSQLDGKGRITLLRQRNSKRQTEEQIAEIDEKLATLNAYLGDETEAKLIVRNNLYPNVNIAFGKYNFKVDRLYNRVHVTSDHKEIIIRPFD